MKIIITISVSVLSAIGVFYFVSASGCIGENSLFPSRDGVAATKIISAEATTHFEIPLGKKRVSARLALTDLERSRGLMYCKGLDADEGMIFVYPTEDARSFWMMNVPINLSIGFFDSTGRLLETHEMNAEDLTAIRSDSDCVQYCLEMREGWFRENAVEPGAQLDLDVLKNAISKRGFQPEHLVE